MGSMSIWHWMVLLVIVLVLFGAGKIPRLMGDMAKGVKAFKSGLKDDENAPPPADQTAAPQVQSSQGVRPVGEPQKEAPKV